MPDKDEILDEWEQASEAWADFVREGKDYCRDEMNNPAAFRIIGNVRGKQVLDMSCGEGYNTRLLTEKGAHVVGIDFSEKMIALARRVEKSQKLGIKYYVSDAADLKEFEKEQFDLVTCIMALMDIERYEDAISEAARVLKKNGRFVFSVTHPCFETGVAGDGEVLARWIYEGETDDPMKRTAFLEVRNYFRTAQYEIDWNMKRLSKPFKTTSFHRSLTDYFQALHKSGLLVTQLVEPKPTSQGILKFPPLKNHTRIPLSIIIEAVKIARH